MSTSSTATLRWRALKAGALYFLLVFGAGFALGILRVLWAEPRFGTRAAELMEMPLMLAAIVFAARWTSRGLHAASARAAMGLLALSLLVIAELSLVLVLRGISLAEYIQSRDPISGTAYLAMLLVFAAMPSVLGRL